MPVRDKGKTRKVWMWVFASPDALLAVHSKQRFYVAEPAPEPWNYYV